MVKPEDLVTSAELALVPTQIQKQVLRRVYGPETVADYEAHKMHYQGSFADFKQFAFSDIGTSIIDPLHKKRIGSIQIRVDMPTKYARNFQVNVSNPEWRKDLCSTIQNALNKSVSGGVKNVVLHADGRLASELPNHHFLLTRQVSASVPELEAHFNHMVWKNGDDYHESRQDLHQSLDRNFTLPVSSQQGSEERVDKFCKEVGERVVASITKQLEAVRTEHILEEEGHKKVEENMRVQIRALLNDPSLYRAVHEQYVDARVSDFLRDHAHQHPNGAELHIENLMIEELVQMVQSAVKGKSGRAKIMAWDEEEEKIQKSIQLFRKHGSAAGVKRDQLRHTESRMDMLRRVLSSSMCGIGNNDSFFKLIMHGGRVYEMHFKRGGVHPSAARRAEVHKGHHALRRHSHRSALAHKAAHGGISVHKAKPFIPRRRKQEKKCMCDKCMCKKCMCVKTPKRIPILKKFRADKKKKKEEEKSDSEDGKNKLFLKVRGKDGTVRVVRVAAQNVEIAQVGGEEVANKEGSDGELEALEDLDELEDPDELEELGKEKNSDSEDEFEKDLKSVEELDELDELDALLSKEGTKKPVLSRLGEPVHPLKDFSKVKDKYSNFFEVYKRVMENENVREGVASSPCVYVSLQNNSRFPVNKLAETLRSEKRLSRFGQGVVAIASQKHDDRAKVIQMRTLGGQDIQISEDGSVSTNGSRKASKAEFAYSKEHPVVFVLISPNGQK